MKKGFIIILLMALVSGIFTSCENGNWEFPDFEYSAVYFAYQSPVRTIVLGEDVFDTSLDNEYKCQIMATMGGVYDNTKDIEIGIRVDNSLCDGLVFDGTDREVLPMPTNYYSLSSDKITIKKGSVLGGVTVQLTDAFFNDPKSLEANYVIPVVMTNVVNADSILSGIPLVDNPRRAVSEDWDVQPKDYILYAVKFINKHHGNYLRRGVSVVTKDGVTKNEVRHKQYVENDEVVEFKSLGLNSLEHPVNYFSRLGHHLNFKLKIDFDNANEFTINRTADQYYINDSIRVYNISASGKGKFVEKGEKNSWGNKDRDAAYMKYDVKYEVEITFPNAKEPADYQSVSYSTTDTLVIRDRGVKAEWFATGLKD